MVNAHSERRSGKFVIPGEKLGVIEEFMPGPGTYVYNGTIYSKITGRTLVDVLSKKVSVYPVVHTAPVPRVGSIVVGQVYNVQSKISIIRIWRIGKKLLSGFFSGILHISDVSRGYIEHMHDAYKTGDIVRAKVISEKNRAYHLSTAEKNLGAIFAFCSNCGHLLRLERGRLKCPRCGNIEKRKIASDYGRAI
ncbi:MAG TPA: RNA-binding protein [Candidatus Bathyarchaeota archaeon]|nr:RNA-binding protein [Candidatus Bathyarchaeota archaeon]